MAKDQKNDLFADERIVVSLDAAVGSDLGLFSISKAVDINTARKILKLLLKKGVTIK